MNRKRAANCKRVLKRCSQKAERRSQDRELQGLVVEILEEHLAAKVDLPVLILILVATFGDSPKRICERGAVHSSAHGLHFEGRITKKRRHHEQPRT